MKKGEKAVRGVSSAEAAAARVLSGRVRRPYAILSARYSTLLSSRNGRNSLKTVIDGTFYPSLKPGVFATNIAAVERHS
jgi:hypothetical protein